jgi:putative transposase
MNTYKRHRFPPEIISYAVWVYYRFNMSHRDVKDLLAERGIIVSLVGPRPPLPQEVAEYSAYEKKRLAIKSGITCTWQVSSRSDIPFRACHTPLPQHPFCRRNPSLAEMDKL